MTDKHSGLLNEMNEIHFRPALSEVSHMIYFVKRSSVVVFPEKAVLSLGRAAASVNHVLTFH